MNERQRRSLASSLRRVNKKPAAAEGEEGEGGGGKEGGTTTRISGGAAAILTAAVWLKMLPKSQLKPPSQSQSRSLLLPSLLLLLFGFAAFFLDSCSCYAGKLCCLSLTHTHTQTPIQHQQQQQQEVFHLFGLCLLLLLLLLYYYSYFGVVFFFVRSLVRSFVFWLCPWKTSTKQTARGNFLAAAAQSKRSQEIRQSRAAFSARRRWRETIAVGVGVVGVAMGAAVGVEVVLAV